MSDYQSLAERLAQRGIDVEAVKTKLKEQKVETPSWGYGNSGTRFKTFAYPGAANTTREKIADAAMVNRLTGICPTVALHIPWDKVDDWNDLRQYAESLGVGIGAINTNTFQADIYKFGSITHPDATVRRTAVEHHLECVEIAKKAGSNAISLWYADGTNYPGQDSFRERRHRMIDSLSQVYAAMPPSMRMLIEYKFYEPAFYHTDLSDWGVAYSVAQKLGPQAQVLVDTGHHAQGTNIEHIVATLLDLEKLGGFHFNARKYGDDDLIVGTTNPFELFLIFNELVDAGDLARDVAYMIDQSHNIEPKMEAMLQSVVNIQSAYAKSLVVDREALKQRRADCDVLGAYRVLADAYETDVRPLLEMVRTELDLSPDPIAALRESGYEKKVAAERGVADAGGGYPT
jgi:L-rhamnose isomerase / sugar isomerase